MAMKNAETEPPFFSICIPQHERTDFLLEAIASLAVQKFRSFELCISDDNSQDGRQREIIAAMDRAGLPYKFEIQAKNRRYDGNLRTAISLARGKYCFLLGNDDALLDEHALGHFYNLICEHGPCGVVISDYQDYRSGAITNRVQTTGNRGAGPAVAAGHFRNFSFVSGVVLERHPAQSFATDRWDGSEMYQTFIGCRIIASGRSLLEIAEPLIRKDIRLPNVEVDSYATRRRLHPCPIIERTIPLVALGRLTADAISPYVLGIERQRQNARILRQLFLFTYPFWLFEYRAVQSWSYALGVALGMRPKYSIPGIELSRLDRLATRLCYIAASLAGLTMPRWLFNYTRPLLYRLAKRT
jgi:glycosyltransferase involved in cell wall biosynthesis